MNRREKRRLGKQGRQPGVRTLQVGVNATPGQVHLKFSIKTDRVMWSPPEARQVAEFLVKQAGAAEALADNLAMEAQAVRERTAASST